MKIAQLHRRLSVQLVVLLTIALLPVGSIALFQTQRVAAETAEAASLALLGMTERAAQGEQMLIERAVGAARLFGKIAPDLIEEPENCALVLSHFVTASPDYSFVGVQPKSGAGRCSSTPGADDYRTFPGLTQAIEEQAATIVLNQSAAVPAPSSFVVSEPYEVDGVFGGLISIFVPQRSVPKTSEQLAALGLVELITFNQNGTILTARSSFAQAKQELPSDRDLMGLSADGAQTFRATNRAGIERKYSIVTIDRSPAAVLAIWRLNQGALRGFLSTFAPALFPVLMWFASMGVAMLAMHTLVLRHLRRMRQRMDEFADTRRVEDDLDTGSLTPIEIEDLEANFQRMSEEIVRDEARWEDALREKGVLVKEIHHRVKNNLQLISSIMNMQIRSAKHDETRSMLRRVQDRVLSLATIHRDLYQSQDSGRVQVGALIKEIVEKSVNLAATDGVKLEVKKDIAPILLYPDQAVPLSLLVAEATANAMKYLGSTGDMPPRLEVHLRQDGAVCNLRVANTVGDADDRDGTGLGAKLMNAFALQLGGQIEIEQTDDFYAMSLHFMAEEFEPEARDY